MSTNEALPKPYKIDACGIELWIEEQVRDHGDARYAAGVANERAKMRGRNTAPFNADDLRLPLPALPEPHIDSTEDEYALHRAPEVLAFGAACYRLGLSTQPAPSAAARAEPKPQDIILYNGSSDAPYIDIDGADLWCNAEDFAPEHRWKIRWMVDAARAALSSPQPLAEPRAEPIGWLESPHGAFRANQLFLWDFQPQSIHWQIPLYLAAAPAAKPLINDALIERMKAAIEGECDGLAIDNAHAWAILEYVLAAA